MAPSLFDCTGLIAVVSGGGTGIGLAMSTALARHGAVVYIMGRRRDRLEQVAKDFATTRVSGKIVPLPCDVTSKDSLATAAATIGEEVGYVNLVVANAGVSGPTSRTLLESAEPLTIQDVQKHLWGFSMAEVLKTYEVNVAAVLFTAVAFLDLLDTGNKKGNMEQKSQIIITSSIGGFHRHWQSSGLPYVTSKAAVTHLGKSLANCFQEWKIRVNCIAPGGKIPSPTSKLY